MISLLRRPRRLGLERLENRQMLTASAPTVLDVTVASSAWTSNYVDYLASHNLGTGGYSVPTGSAQLAALPWNNLNQIKVKFSEDVKVDLSDLTLTGVNVTQYQFSSFSYNSQTHVATWTLAADIGNDKLLIDLAGNGLDPIIDLDDGYVLDGEWTNGSDTFPSGNGTQGGDFEFRFNVLPGDVNQTNSVAALDYTLVWNKRNTSTTSGAYNPLYDIDGSGAINAVDYSFVFAKIGTSLISGNPAGTSNDAPTSSLNQNALQLEEDSVDSVISLWDAFADLENNDGQLSYQVISNSNSSLFASVDIDVDNGVMILNTADNAYGTADIVVRATDTQGLYINATLHVEVSALNDAPVISNFFATTEALDIWILTGCVGDVDDAVQGWTVYFYGVLDGLQAIVEADGTFELIVQLDPYIYGEVWVQVTDSHGAVSNTPVAYIGVT